MPPLTREQKIAKCQSIIGEFNGEMNIPKDHEYWTLKSEVCKPVSQ